VDAKRGQIFTKLAKVISVAAGDGGDDPASNSSLRMAIDNAKAFSMPKENIERALRRAQGKLGGDIETVVYEAYGPGGVAILIECLTNNKNRALSEIKNALTKNGGNFAGAGSVAYLFQKKGEIIIEGAKQNKSADEIEEIIIDSGADDYESEGGIYIVYAGTNDLYRVQENLKSAGLTIESSELSYVAKNHIDVPDDKQSRAETLVEALNDLEDVNRVYTNASM